MINEFTLRAQHASQSILQPKKKKFDCCIQSTEEKKCIAFDHLSNQALKKETHFRNAIFPFELSKYKHSHFGSVENSFKWWSLCNILIRYTEMNIFYRYLIGSEWIMMHYLLDDVAQIPFEESASAVKQQPDCVVFLC